MILSLVLASFHYFTICQFPIVCWILPFQYLYLRDCIYKRITKQRHLWIAKPIHSDVPLQTQPLHLKENIPVAFLNHVISAELKFWIRVYRACGLTYGVLGAVLGLLFSEDSSRQIINKIQKHKTWVVKVYNYLPSQLHSKCTVLALTHSKSST